MPAEVVANIHLLCLHSISFLTLRDTTKSVQLGACLCYAAVGWKRSSEVLTCKNLAKKSAFSDHPDNPHLAHTAEELLADIEINNLDGCVTIITA
jgi:hypothetical protein